MEIINEARLEATKRWPKIGGESQLAMANERYRRGFRQGAEWLAERYQHSCPKCGTDFLSDGPRDGTTYCTDCTFKAGQEDSASKVNPEHLLHAVSTSIHAQRIEHLRNGNELPNRSWIRASEIVKQIMQNLGGGS